MVERHESVEPLRRQWDGLADRTGPEPWLRSGWIAAWWRAFGRGSLFVLALRRGGTPRRRPVDQDASRHTPVASLVPHARVDAHAECEFHEAVDVLAPELHQWDIGLWSRYNLFPRWVANLANPLYRRLQITLLQAMRVPAPRPRFDATIERFDALGRTPRNVRRAYARKLLFRLFSPRRAGLRRMLPWAPRLDG